MDIQRLKGQSALVTGSSSGIGLSVAISLAEAGANIVVNYNSDEKAAEQVVSIIKGFGGQAFAYGADVSKEDEVRAMFQKMFDVYGTIDILVNNAGIQKDAPFHEMSLKDWQMVLDINLTSQFLCSREAVKEFLRRGIVEERSRACGKIISMSSVHDIIPWAGHVNYATSKGGILMLVKSMAQELAPHKIRVNGISPGAIKTSINDDVWKDPVQTDNLLKLIPYKRLGEPEDVGQLAAWLASDEADYITGTTIYIDGGMTLYPGFAGNG